MQMYCMFQLNPVSQDHMYAKHPASSSHCMMVAKKDSC
jgi:hypothetical protein